MANFFVKKNEAAAQKKSAIDRFIESRRRALLGVPEIVALSAAALLFLAAVASYFLMLRPQRARLEALADEQRRLDRALQGARTQDEASLSTQASVEKILASLQDFEAKHLSPATSLSTTEVAGELNTLIRRHSLHLSGGINFTQFEGRGAEGQPAASRTAGASKPIQNVYPGVGISTAVEGPYANLRRFIRDVESHNSRFIVINSIDLEGVTDTGVRQAMPDVGAGGTTPAAPVAPSRGALVALRLDMAAYFRRPSVAPAPEATAPPR